MWQSGRAASFCSGFNLHSAGLGEGDPLLGVGRHAVNQRGSLAYVEFGVKLRQALDGFDKPLQLSAPDHDLVDPVRQFITPALGFFEPAVQRFVPLVVLGLVLSHPCVLGNQVVDLLGVDAWAIEPESCPYFPTGIPAPVQSVTGRNTLLTGHFLPLKRLTNHRKRGKTPPVAT